MKWKTFNKIISLIMMATIAFMATWIFSEVNTVKGAAMIAGSFLSGIYAYWICNFLTEK
tara:strand:+ start:676 stop:852 length:177 start_codon:yes stop_codon:yes gene_type:complete